ncbi:MAG: YqgE/AlgH family protein [Oceanospirillaceae bacterium]|nr:YqgE/AlgH family protein [Oceanospirillaceae bacterium]
MSHTTNLRGHFLLSMPHMQDRYFAQSLIYLCEHSDAGAMGIIVNRAVPIELHTLFSHLNLGTTDNLQDETVYFGGPVQPERGFILHPADSGHWNATSDVDASTSLTTSIDILEDIAAGKGPSDRLVVLGYAGWGAGQLEQEISDNAWLSCPANSDIMFRTPIEERLNAAAMLLGINLDLLTADTGHA